jgi:hypothetical protein
MMMMAMDGHGEKQKSESKQNNLLLTMSVMTMSIMPLLAPCMPAFHAQHSPLNLTR